MGRRGPRVCDGHHRERSIQNNSGLPQGPADPSTGRLLMRQTACARRFLAGMIGGGTRGREPHARHAGGASSSPCSAVRQPAGRSAHAHNKAIGCGWLVCCSQWRRATRKRKCASRRLRPGCESWAGRRGATFAWSTAGRRATPPSCTARQMSWSASAPDLILATSTPVLGALRQGNPLPIVFVQVTDPVGGGFVPNLARPGGYLTGFTSFEFTVGSKWLEALKHVAPAVQRVALIFNPDTAPFAHLFWQPVVDAAPAFDVEPIQTPSATPVRSSTLSRPSRREANGGLMVLPDVSTNQLSRPDHRARCTAPSARGLSLSVLRSEWRADVLR